MSEETKAEDFTDPMELWKQWYETASKVWTNMLDGGKEGSMDPYSLYRTWMKNVEDAREKLMASSSEIMDPNEVWRQWFEITTGFWEKASEILRDPLGLTAQWMEMMEDARAKLLTERGLPSDPFTYLKQWYDATSETWSTIIGDTIGSEKFVEASSKLLESYTSFYSTFRRSSEEYFRNLQLPTRSDLARVAGLVINLEDKVDRIESALEDFEDRYAKMATSDAVIALEGHLSKVEGKLDQLPATLGKDRAASQLQASDLQERINKLESKLDQLPATLEKGRAASDLQASSQQEHINRLDSKLNQLPVTLEQDRAVERLAKRLDSVESKLDAVLAALVKAKEYPKTVKSNDAAGSKRRKSNENHQEG